MANIVNRELIVAAYQLILGREPESEEVVESAVRQHDTVEQVRTRFFFSDEYARQIAATFHEKRNLMDFAVELPIQVECEPAQMQRLLERIERVWERLGKEDPYWSVLTNRSFASEQFQQNQEAFWIAGREDMLRLTRCLERNGIPPRPEWTCLEYGCGAGRVTRWLAERFRSTIACDISASHLRIAAGVQGAHFVRIGALADIDNLPEADLIFSIIVLQHNPPPVIAAIADRLLKRLRPGGIAYIQIPTFKNDYTFDVASYLADQSEAGIELHVLPQRHVFAIARANGCEVVEAQPDNRVGMPNCMSTTFLLRKRSGREP